MGIIDDNITHSNVTSDTMVVYVYNMWPSDQILNYTQDKEIQQITIQLIILVTVD